MDRRRGTFICNRRSRSGNLFFPWCRFQIDFSRLTEDYPETAVVRLTQNYRSTPEILSGALHVISHNPGERTLSANYSSGTPVRLVDCSSELSEGIFIAKEIARMTADLICWEKGATKNFRSFGEIAVLARTHRHCL